TISMTEGLTFAFEIKVRDTTYITPFYTAPATITFDPFNTAPVATDVSVSAQMNTATALTLNATDAENDALTYTYTQPANGTLSGTAPHLTYTSTSGFAGTDSFTFTADDGIATSNQATVSVTVLANPFIISVNATDGTFILPLKTGLTYDFTASYDGATTTHTTDANLTLTFPSGPGIYDVAISGTFPAINFNNDKNGDKAKLLDIKQWGNGAWETMENAFNGCTNLQISATDTPNLSNVTNMQSTFKGCKALTSLNATNWDVSNVTTMKWTFHSAGPGSLDISTWDTSSVETFYRTFANSRFALVGYENWDLSSATTLYGMFQGYRGMTSIDVSNWKTTNKLEGLHRVFAGSSLTEVNGLENLNVTNVIWIDRLVNEDFVFPTATYDTILTAWANQITEPSPGHPWLTTASRYTPFSEAAAARQHLIGMHWTITDAGTVAGIHPFTTTSITSPIRISGWNDVATNTLTATVNGASQAMTVWEDSLWYTDVTLNPTQRLPFTVSFNGTAVKTGELTWVPTLINTTSSQAVTIRKGSTLLIGSAVHTGALLEIDTDGDGVYDLSGTPT
ncbi:hypothetical protein BVX99_03425, partial [bacterium F16]